jgi:2-phosphosulfolactate phosphatase
VLYEVVFDWKRMPDRDLNRSVVVVADILRATTVMIRALQNGARDILPQENDADARSLLQQMKEQGEPVLLCGEKEGFKRPGYDLGNSPLEFTPERVKDHSIIHLTTNGTRAMKAAQGAQEILIAAFSNMSAVAEELRQLEDNSEHILFVVSGREGEYCIEDTVCLGGIVLELLQPPGRSVCINDAGRTAVDLFQIYRGDLISMLRQSYHGRYLEEMGLGEDIPECARLDTTDRVPRMSQGRVK